LNTAGETDALTAASPGAGNGRLILALIAGIPLIMILAASWLWYFVVRGDLDIVGTLGTANRGELLRPPRQALDAGWQSVDGEPFALPEEPKWLLLVPQRGADCDAACEERLFLARQIHTLLGKNMDRVRRALVTDAAPGSLRLTVETLSDDRPLPADFETYRQREQRGLDVWYSDVASFEALFPEYLQQDDSWYLVDPAGWVMMRYDETVPYKDVISDLKFLLKNSNG